MLNLIVKEAAPTVAKVIADVAVKVITEYPLQTATVVFLCYAAYQRGRADTYDEIFRLKNVSI